MWNTLNCSSQYLFCKTLASIFWRFDYLFDRCSKERWTRVFLLYCKIVWMLMINEAISVEWKMHIFTKILFGTLKHKWIIFLTIFYKEKVSHFYSKDLKINYPQYLSLITFNLRSENSVINHTISLVLIIFPLFITFLL